MGKKYFRKNFQGTRIPVVSRRLVKKMNFQKSLSSRSRHQFSMVRISVSHPLHISDSRQSYCLAELLRENMFNSAPGFEQRNKDVQACHTGRNTFLWASFALHLIIRALWSKLISLGLLTFSYLREKRWSKFQILRAGRQVYWEDVWGSLVSIIPTQMEIFFGWRLRHARTSPGPSKIQAQPRKIYYYLLRATLSSQKQKAGESSASSRVSVVGYPQYSNQSLIFQVQPFCTQTVHQRHCTPYAYSHIVH